MKRQLEEAIEKFFDDFLEEHAFRLIGEKSYGLGALKDYESENLYIRIVNDKGIVSLEVAPKGQPDKLRDIALYKDLLEPPAHGCWNLSMQEQAGYLVKNREWFTTNLSGKSIDLTIKKVDDCARKRLKHISC